MKTGFEKLNNIVEFSEGSLSVLASRPAMGKTTFVLNIINNILKESNTPILLFSLELSKENIINKLKSMQLKIDRNSYMEKIDNFKLYIDDTPNISIMEISNKSKSLFSKHNIGMIVIDYLQLVQFDKQKLLSRDNEITEILLELKKLSKELNIPIIITSQLSRNLEKRDNKRPLIKDFTNSKDGICKYCDNILFLYRDSYYYEDSINNNNCELIVANNLKDQDGTVYLSFLPEYCTYSNRKKEK